MTDWRDWNPGDRCYVVDSTLRVITGATIISTRPACTVVQRDTCRNQFLLSPDWVYRERADAEPRLAEVERWYALYVLAGGGRT